MPQELNLFHATIRDNITLLDGTIGDADVWEALDLAGAASFVRQLPHGLETDVGEMGFQAVGWRAAAHLAGACVVVAALDPHP